MATTAGRESFTIAEFSALSDVIGRIYAEEIRAESWGEIIRLLGRLISFKAVGGVRISDSVPTEWIPLMPDAGHRHDEIREDVIAMVQKAADLGLTVWRPTDALSAEEWEGNPIRPYLSARGLGDMISALCVTGPGEIANFCLAREEIESPFSIRDIFLLRHLQTHAGTAMRLRREAASMEAAAETFRQVMRPGYVCALSGKILEMNKFGRRVIEDSEKDPQAVRELIEETARRLIEAGENWGHIDLFGDMGRLSVHSLDLKTNPPRCVVVLDSYEYFRRVLRHRMQDAGLTAREIEICMQLVKGMSNKEISAALFIAESTVKDHMTSILEKFEVTRRSAIVPKLLGHDV